MVGAMDVEGLLEGACDGDMEGTLDSEGRDDG